MGKIKESFSAGEAAKITGVSYRNLDHWARTKFIVPSISEARGTGTERKYAFDDLVALRVARDDRGVAFVMVEHDVELVLELSEQVTVLDFGRVIAHGSPAEIRSSAEVQAAYLGTAVDADAT